LFLPAGRNFVTQPSLCHIPVTFHGSGRDAKNFGGFFDAQTAKISEFDDSLLSLVKHGKSFKCFVERD